MVTTMQVKDALLVPAGALRFTPPEPDNAPRSGGGITSMLLPRFPRTAQTKSKNAVQQVWVLRNGQPVAVAVKTGASDGRETQILEGDLKEGMPVITELVSAKK